MEVNMSSPVPEISTMENDGGQVGAIKLSKSQINKRKKALKKQMKKDMESLDKREDTGNPESNVTCMLSPQDHLNSGVATTAAEKMTVLTPAVNKDGKISTSGMENDGGLVADVKLSRSQINNSKRELYKQFKKDLESLDNLEGTGTPKSNITAMSSLQDHLNSGLVTTAVVDQKMPVLTPAVNEDGKSSILGMENDRGHVVGVKLSRSQINNRKRALKKKMNKSLEDTENAKSNVTAMSSHFSNKPEVHFSNISMSSFPDKSNSGLSATAIVDQKMTVSTVAATGDGKSLNSGTENDKGNGAAKLTKSQRRKMRKLAEKESNAMRVGQTKKQKVNRRPTIGEILDPLYLQKLEAANDDGSGITAPDKPASKKSKTQKNVNKNPALGCGNTQDKAIAEKGSGTGKVFDAISGDMVASKSVVPDVIMVPKREQHTEVVNGNTATDNSTSKKRKRQRQKNENKNLASGDIMKTCEKVIEEKGSGTTKSIEAISSEMVTGKNTIPDASMVSKVVDPAEVANGKTATDNPASKKKRRRGNKNKKPVLGDITTTCDNTQEKVIAENGLGITKSTEAIRSEMVTDKNAIPDSSMVSKVEEHTEVANGKTGPGTAATDTTASKKRKRQKFKKKGLASDGILSTGESTQDTVIVNKVSGTNKPLEALSTESKREDFPEVLGGEKGPNTITGDAESTMLKTIGCTKVGNSEMGSTGTTTTAQNSPLPKKTPRQREKQKSVALNTINNTEVKQITQVATLGKKLVIFDVNGLLADVVSPRPKDVKADKLIPRRAIFKRPFLDDFLCFCFERFNVGIWSSRTKKVLDPVVDFLLGDLKNKLLFLWDASQCTNSGLRTLEDRHKPVVFKDLRKIWEKKDPENRWVKGTFNELNTLLLDDSPYKALLNPKHSGIFPASYTYKNKDDDFLGPKGELRTYLEGLAAADNLKSYVEQHPFGQGAIDEKNPHWPYYSRALKGQNR